MIGRIIGQIGGRGANWVLVDVGGVGYQIDISPRTLSQLPPDGDMVTLAIETYVREDRIQLFGFMDEAERDWYRLLISVQGVGARMALAMLGALTPQDIAQAIQTDDKALLARAPGVGPKLAQKIILALHEKLPDSYLSTSFTQASENAAYTDALAALVQLGYSRAHARQAIIQSQSIDNTGAAANTDTQDIIKAALRKLG